MPDVGFRDGGQSHAVEPLLQLGNALGATLIGTIVVGTVAYAAGAGGTGGTVKGAAVLISRKFSIIEGVEAVSSAIQSGTLAPVSAKVIGFGRTMGTMVATLGTLMATILPGSNNILVQFFVIGTIGTVGTGNLPPNPIADGTRITGSVVAVIDGR